MIHYVDSDPTGLTKRTLLLFHGLGANLHYWDSVMEKLPSDLRTIAFDMPGFGQSKTPPGSFTLEQAAKDVVRIIHNLGLGNYTIAGHSFGGLFALELARLEQAKVDRLILVDAHLMRALKILSDPREALNYPMAAVALASIIFGSLVPGRSAIASAVSGNELTRRIFMWPTAYRPAILDPDLLVRAFKHSTNRAVIPALRGSRSFNLTELAMSIKTPISLIYGDKDRLITESDLELASSLFELDDVAVLKDCGHWPMFEQPDALAKWLNTRV